MTTATLRTVLHHIRRLTPAQKAANDGQLLRLFLTRRDEAAFAELVRRHGPLILGVCRRLLANPSDVEDAFQATFLVLVRRAAMLEESCCLGPWLYGVARRTALKARAAALRRPASLTEVFDMAAPESADPLANRELRQILDEELDRLPEKYRAPLVLCYLQGRTHEQAARELGRPHGSMSRHIGRALELLRGRLCRRGVVLPVAAVGVFLTNRLAAGVLPAALVAGTVRAALLVASGGSAAAPVTALACAVARELAHSRVRTGTASVLALALLVGGAGLVALHTPAIPAEPPAPPSKAEAEAPARADREDDPLPAGALKRFGSPRLRHGQAVTGLAFAPDGKRLVSGSWDRTISLWELPSGKELRRFEGHTNASRGVALSPDGKFIASGGNNEFLLWDAATGKELHRAAGLTGEVWSVAFSPDSKLAAYGLFDPAAKITGGRIVAAATGKEVVTLNGHSNVVRAIAFSPDGKTVATASYDQTVRLWESATGKETAQLTGHESGVLCVAFAADGKTLASGGSDGKLRLWDLATAKETNQFDAEEGRRGDVAGVSFSPDGKRVAACAVTSRVVRVFDIASGKETHTFPGGWFRCVVFSPDGKTLAAGDGYNAIHLWEMPSGKILQPAEAHDSGVHCLTLSPDGATLAAGTYWKNVQLWDMKTGRPLRRLEGHEHSVYPVVYSPDGRHVASGSRDGTARVWDAATGKELHKFFSYDGDKVGQVWVYGLAFSPDGKHLAGTCRHGGGALNNVTGENEVRIWDIEGGKEVCRCEGHTSLIYAVAFSRDGKTLFSCGEDGAVRVWDAATGKAQRTIGEGAWFGESLAVSPDGGLLAVGCRDGNVRLFDIAGGRLLQEMKEHANFAYRQSLFRDGRTLAFSPDGRMLASGSWQVVQLWDVAAGQERLSFTAHRGEVMSVAFLPDGRRLATGSPDTTVVVWDLATCTFAGRAAAAKVTAMDVEGLWADLFGEDGHKSYRALWTLATAPKEALPLLRTRLKPAAATDRQRLERLLKDLDADDFEVREKATDELAKFGTAAEPALRKLLEGKPSAEVKQRVELVLGKLPAASASLERIGESRALELLEQLRTPEAMALLKELARGDADAWLTREAKAALNRLSRARSAAE
jgi:RNA polymerase sigma factor (sigma-70 family)